LPSEVIELEAVWVSDLSVRALRISAVILALITAGIHFRYAFGRFTPLSIAFAAMGVIYVVGAAMILWGKPLFIKLMLIYTIAIIIIYLYAIIQPLPPFTERAFTPSILPVLTKMVEVLLVANLGFLSGRR
jgi:hypothetical protein